MWQGSRVQSTDFLHGNNPVSSAVTWALLQSTPHRTLNKFLSLVLLAYMKFQSISHHHCSLALPFSVPPLPYFLLHMVKLISSWLSHRPGANHMPSYEILPPSLLTGLSNKHVYCAWYVLSTKKEGNGPHPAETFQLSSWYRLQAALLVSTGKDRIISKQFGIT